MFEKYGIKRVEGVPDTLPVLAWRLDSRKIVFENEILLQVTDIRIEASSFKQICNESRNDPDEIKERIMTLVTSRGKLHNPYTDTGGLIAGVVERIGSEYKNKESLKVGDRVLPLVSASMIPLHIEKIHEINLVNGDLKVDGYCILNSLSPIVKRTDEIALDLLMAAFEESSSIFHIYQLAKEKTEFLVIGSDIVTIMLYGHAIRKATGNKGRIVAILYQMPEFLESFNKSSLGDLIGNVYDDMYYLNIGDSLRCAEKIIMNHPTLFDISINCANARGAETINVLATKERGTIFFSNLINNYNIALFLAEGMGKELEILCADGYKNDYEGFMFEFLEEIRDSMDKVHKCLYKSNSRPISGIKINRVDDEQITRDLSIGYDFIFNSHSMKALAREIIKASKYDCTVLIEGETGVGKEKVAKLIHNLSDRKMHPLISVNCASIPENLMEAEFFGYDAGAFTGAGSLGKTGYFEQANKGILFLDEVSELPFEVQSKLLRALQDKMFYHVGGEHPIKVDVRVIAATNANIKNRMKGGGFREDLYYRLAVLTMHIPPLRMRKADIIPLAEHFVNEYNNKFRLNKRIDDEGFQCLLEYEWPGNIRELENVIQRLLIYTDSDVIDRVCTLKELYRIHQRQEIDSNFGNDEFSLRKKSYRHQIEQLEKQLIIDALQKCGTTRKAAKYLGISQAQFMRKKTKHLI